MRTRIKFTEDVNGHKKGEKAVYSVRAAKTLVCAGVAEKVADVPDTQEVTHDDDEPTQPAGDAGADPQPDQPAD